MIFLKSIQFYYNNMYYNKREKMTTRCKTEVDKRDKLAKEINIIIYTMW